MDKIPTVEEYLKNVIVFISDNTYDDYFISYENATEKMIEFAKLHVKAAIKECIESAPSGSSTDTVSYDDVVEALTDCYPLEDRKSVV